MHSVFEDKTILVTGGTGSLGQKIARRLLEYNPRVIRIFSNDEDSIFRTQQLFRDNKEFRYFLGNIAEKERLSRAMEDVDIVFHTAALKHVHICEYNPFEAVKTNIYGMQNVIDTSIDNDVEKVLFTSSDKAVNPSNTMGVSKLMGEKLITTANFFKGKHPTVFSTIRLGNVIGSRGSVIPIFKKQIERGNDVTVTDFGMTRYVMTVEETINNIFNVVGLSKGGEIFIPKMRSMNIQELAKAMVQKIGNDVNIREIGMKLGEKLYEELVTEEEKTRTFELDSFFMILPLNTELYKVDHTVYENCKKAEQIYNSHEAEKMSSDEIISLLLREKLL